MRKELLEVLSQIRPEEQEILDGNICVHKELYTSANEFIVDSRKVTGRKKLMQLRPHTRFTDFPLHRHDYIEMMYVCKGHNIHIIDGHEIDVKAGEFLLLNQYSWHEIKKSDEGDIAINFIILPEFFDKPFTMLGFNNVITEFLINILRKDSNKGEFLYFKVSDILSVQNLVENMVTMLISDQQNDTILQTTMGLLFMYLAMNLDRINKGAKKQFNDMLMEESCNYIEINYKEASLSELAERLHQSQYFLSRLIKEKTGQTFKEIVQERRFYRAMELLRKTDLSVNDIIASVGYENASYFRRKFKEKYNVTPKEYRIKYKEA